MGLFNDMTPFIFPVVLGDINADTNCLLIKAPAAMKIKQVLLGVGTNIAQSDSNYAVVTVKNGATTVADFSTKTTGGDAALTADTPVVIPLETGEDELAANDILKLDIDLTGTTVLDEAWIQVEAYYL